MIFLREMALRPPVDDTRYPFSAHILHTFTSLAFDRPVTVLAGENGSGKSTLMELAAAGAGAHTIGNSGTRAQKSRLFREASRRMSYAFNKRPARSFFFTAEDFVRYLDERCAMQREAEAALADIEREYAGRSAYARGLAAMPHRSTLGDMAGQYSRELLESSHGEGFLAFFGARLAPDGLYLLDEPEGALSFANQLGLLALIHRAADMNCQVIMATHSPVLCAYPGAQLLSVGQAGLAATSFEALDSNRFLQYFLANRSRVLRSAGILEDEAGPGPEPG